MIITSPDHFKTPPQKIISLVPSQTELLAWFGLNNEVIGITKFCIHPNDWFTTKTRVGGTKNLNIDLIKKLQPDLIIANKEENTKEQVEELSDQLNVWVTDVNNLEDAISMISDLGKLNHLTEKAGDLIKNITIGFDQLKTINRKIPAVYLIWQNPYMTVGGDTFINDMMNYCGLENVYKNEKRYPGITIDEIHNSGCELILLSSEPYPFKQEHVIELQDAFPGKKIILVDGEMFSWYGSRLLKSAKYFDHLIGTLKNAE